MLGLWTPCSRRWGDHQGKNVRRTSTCPPVSVCQSSFSFNHGRILSIIFEANSFLSSSSLYASSCSPPLLLVIFFWLFIVLYFMGSLSETSCRSVRSQSLSNHVTFKVLTAVPIQNAIIWDVTPLLTATLLLEGGGSTVLRIDGKLRPFWNTSRPRIWHSLLY